MKNIGVIILFGMLGMMASCSQIFNHNTLKIIVGENMNKGKLKIEHGISATTINRKNDSDLFKYRDNYDVIFDGIINSRIINEYGENDFLITYAEEYYFSFRHFKTNWRHQHEYIFTIFEESNDMHVKVEIKGQDELKIQGKMIPIEQANHHLGNALLDN